MLGRGKKQAKGKTPKNPLAPGAKANAKAAKTTRDIESRAAEVTRNSAERHTEIGGPIKPPARHKKTKKNKEQ